jgi:hypothetical protein
MPENKQIISTNKTIKDKRYATHNDMVKRTLIYLNEELLGVFWSNATGAIKGKNGHYQKYGLVGSADILGISTSGRFIGVEVKTGSGRQTKEQLNFQRIVEKNNGLYVLIRSTSDFLDLKSKISVQAGHSPPVMQA